MKISQDALDKKVQQNVREGAGLDNLAMNIGNMRSCLESCTVALHSIENRSSELKEKDRNDYLLYQTNISEVKEQVKKLQNYASQGGEFESASTYKCADLLVVMATIQSLDYMLTKEYKL